MTAFKIALAAIPPLERDWVAGWRIYQWLRQAKARNSSVKPYTRVVGGKKIRVGAFDRSTPETSKGKKK